VSQITRIDGDRAPLSEREQKEAMTMARDLVIPPRGGPYDRFLPFTSQEKEKAQAIFRRRSRSRVDGDKRIVQHRAVKLLPGHFGRSDRSIVHADRRRRGGECAAAGRPAPEELFKQAPVRLERAHHEPDPAGPVGRRRCSAADRIRRIA
jgi:hypothetical protein